MVQHNSNKEVNPEELFLREPDSCYDKAETDLLRDALLKTYTERFLMTTRLFKIGMMLKNAKVTHQPFIPKQ
jgi:hypothetical protein